MKTKLLELLVKWSALTAIVVAAMPEFASAQGGGGDMAQLINNTVSTQLPAIPRALGAVCYVGGSMMLVSGALSLKKHADNPASEPMAKGIARLLAGGAITGVPTFAGIVQKTAIGGQSGQASYSQFTVSF